MLGVLGLGGGELIVLAAVAIVLVAIVAVGLGLAAYFVIRSLRQDRPQPPAAAQPVKQEVGPQPGGRATERANLAGSRFHEVNLAGAEFDDVNLANARFHNVNLSNVSVSAAQIGGAAFKHVGPPPDSEGKQERQRPVRFEEMMLCDSTFRKVDLSNVRVVDCDLTGMTVDGILVTELLAAYRKQQAQPGT